MQTLKTTLTGLALTSLIALWSAPDSGLGSGLGSGPDVADDVATIFSPNDSQHIVTIAAQFDEDEDVRTTHASSVARIRIAEDGHTVTVTDTDGVLDVTINGNAIPDDRIVRGDDGTVRILDDDGTVLHELHLLARDGQGLRQLRVGADIEQLIRDAWGDAEEITINVNAGEDHPDVMMGIIMNRPGAALCHHLDLDADACTIVAALHEGLAAHAAGLAEHDIIVAVNGTSPADVRSIIDMLHDASVGDALVLDIIRKGARQQVTVTLDAFDQQRIQDAAIIGTIPAEMGAARIRQIGPDGMIEQDLTPGPNRFWAPGNARDMELFVRPGQDGLRLRLGDARIAEALERLNHKNLRLPTLRIPSPTTLERPDHAQALLDIQLQLEHAMNRAREAMADSDQGISKETVDERLHRLEAMLQEMLDRLDD